MLLNRWIAAVKLFGEVNHIGAIGHQLRIGLALNVVVFCSIGGPVVLL